MTFSSLPDRQDCGVDTDYNNRFTILHAALLGAILSAPFWYMVARAVMYVIHAVHFGGAR